MQMTAQPGIARTSSVQRPTHAQHSASDRAINEPIQPVEQGVSDIILSLEQNSLLEIITELIGPIAPTLIQQVAAQAPSTKELIENLMVYLSPSQRIEFEKKARTRLTKSVARIPTRTGKAQLMDANFLRQCKDYLIEIIGSIASSLIQTY